MGDSISEGTVQEYTRGIGEFIKADEIVAVVETDKVMVDIRSSHSGIITKFFADEGETIEVGANFFEIDTSADAPAGAEPTKAAEKAPEPTKAAEPVKDAPKAATPPAKAPTPKAAPPPAPKAAKKQAANKAGKAPTTIHGSRGETSVKMTRMRQRISQRLKEAQNTNAMLTTFNEVDMSAFMNIRKEVQD